MAPQLVAGFRQTHAQTALDPHASFVDARYTFLVDSAGRLRWRGSGAASAEELRNFLGAARQLLDEEKT